jgi:phage terminase large subunit-like protein
MSYSLELSGGFIEKIRAICETDFMRRLYPTVIPASPKSAPGPWTNDRLTFLNGTSLTAYTAKSLPTGKHTGDMFVDDLVTKESVNTAELIANTQEVYAQLLSILDPDGTMWMIGTRYSHMDQYGKAIGSPDWQTFIKPCYDENGEPIFPEKFTREALQLIEREQGPYTFSCQYLLNPVPSDEQVFRPEWIRMDAPPTRRGGTVTICVDPAISMAENACSTGITAVESTTIDGQVHRDLRERVRARLNPSQLVEATLGMAERFECVEIGIEAIQYQASIKHYMEIEMRRRGRYFKITEIKSYKGRSKYDRIKGLQPEFSRGLYHLLPDQTDVAQELISFPQGADVDVIDSMAMHQELESYQTVPDVGADFINWYHDQDEREAI